MHFEFPPKCKTFSGVEFDNYNKDERVPNLSVTTVIIRTYSILIESPSQQQQLTLLTPFVLRCFMHFEFPPVAVSSPK